MSGAPNAARALATAALALALDQATKAAARAGIEPGERVDLPLGVDLVRVGNEGIAFGLLDGAADAVLVLTTIAFGLLLAYFLATVGRPRLWLPIGLLAGGALGNLIDRLRQGFVTDFIDLPRWPAFNVADVEITAGVLLLALLWLRDEQRADGGRGDGGS